MSNATPAIFTSDEQIKLIGLQENCRLFRNLTLLLEMNSFKGSEAQSVMESINLAKNLFNQAQQGVAQLEQGAKNRANTPKVVEPQAPVPAPENPPVAELEYFL